MSTLEYPHVNRPKPESWLTTICILIIVGTLALFVHWNDQEHERSEKEKEGLRSTVAIQAAALNTAMNELAKQCPDTEKGKRRGS